MDNTEKEKIVRFLHDKLTSEAVRDFLLFSFLRPHPNADVQLLAASRLAIDLLQDGWKEMERLKVGGEEKQKSGGNVGL